MLDGIGCAARIQAVAISLRALLEAIQLRLRYPGT